MLRNLNLSELQGGAWVSWLAVLLLSTALCFTHIHQGTLAVDAIRYAHIALNIALSGEWIYLHDDLTDSIYVNKPPLLFWILALIFDSFGYSTFLAKLPSTIFAFSSVLLLVAFTWRYYGERAALWACLLYVIGPSFLQNLVDLSFEGIVACGALACLFALAGFTEEKTRKNVIQNGFLFGLGVLLLLHSKPPYVVLIGLALLIYFASLRPKISSKEIMHFVLAAAPLTLLGLSWFIFRREEYVGAAFQNQVYVPLEAAAPIPLNLSYWALSLVKNYSLSAVFGGYAFFCVLRNFKGSTNLEKLLACWMVGAPIILLFVDVRARYLLVPIFALMILGARQLAGLTSSFNLKYMRMAIIVAALGGSIAFLFFNVSVHRADRFILAVKKDPMLLHDSIIFCVDDLEIKKSASKARMTELLFNLEFGVRPRVINSSNAPGLSFSERRRILANPECAQALGQFLPEHQSRDFSKGILEFQPRS